MLTTFSNTTKRRNLCKTDSRTGAIRYMHHSQTTPSLKACQSLRINPKSIQDVQCLRSHMSRSPTQARYTADQFTAPLLENVEVAYIWGPAGTGKTNWALAHFKCPLLVRHIDGVKQFKKVSTMASFLMTVDSNTGHEACIALTDWDYDSDVHARHYCAFIPAHTPKIFTANHPIEDNFPTIDDALLRRIKHIVHVTKDLRKRITTGSNTDLYGTLKSLPS